MDELLKIENLKLSFDGPQGRVPAVRGVSLSMKPGESLALVGESGCGKTALCRCIMGLHNQHALIEEGSISLAGRLLTGLSEREMEAVRGKEVSMVFQDPMSSLNPPFSVGKQIVEALSAHKKLSSKEARQQAIELLERVGIEDAANGFSRYPHHFSGGMRQRVAIAIALASDPLLLIADEPTTALDGKAQAKVMEVLRQLCCDGQRGFLFITHDLGLAREMADRIAVMKDGLIVEMELTEQIFQNPRHPYTKQLLQLASLGKGSLSISEGDYQAELLKSAPKEDRAAAELSSAERSPIVQVKGLYKSFLLAKGRRLPVLEDFQMTVYQGEVVGLVGESGCGKSTLARCLMGIYEPERGEILLQKQCKRAFIFQDSASAFNPRMTLEEIIGEPLAIGGWKGAFGTEARQRKPIKGAALRQKVLEMARAVNLQEELLPRHPYDVSGGQRQKAAIARALITGPDLLIADEPIASLDVSIQAQIIDLLGRLREEKGLAILLIAHDLAMVKRISDRIVWMR